MYVPAFFCCFVCGMPQTCTPNLRANFLLLFPHTLTKFKFTPQVDIIFDESYTPESSNLLNMAAFTAAYGPEAATLPAVEAGKVYAFNNKLGKSSDDTVSTDWFESATARPDLVSPLATAAHLLSLARALLAECAEAVTRSTPYPLLLS
jgi:hypothetical protein